MPTVEQPYYLKKSIKIFRIYGIAFLISMFTITFFRSVNQGFKGMNEAIVGLSFLIILFLAPFGLYNSVKSFKAKEEPRKKRTMFLIGHLFFCTLIILLLAAVIKDISSLYR